MTIPSTAAKKFLKPSSKPGSTKSPESRRMKTREFPGSGSQLNVLGGPLLTCSDKPITGFFRDGCCNTSEEDFGSHTICVLLTAEFLEYSKAGGNDLSTPRPEYDFPGLQAGQRWCLCAARWLEAYRDGKAPKVSLNSTNQLALEIVPLAALKQYAIDLH